MSNMSIKTFLAVGRKLPVETSVLLRAIHGVGKSQVIRQLALMIAMAEGDANREFIDRRLSQMTEGDMVGLPSTDGEVTRFNPPDWVKRACEKACTIFLDELNRATPEVMQAAFQLVLDRELNGWKLHPQTRVYSAINHTAAYSVNEMDPALLDRFWAINLEPTKEDWLVWGKENNHICGAVLAFHQADAGDKWLDPPKDVEAGQKSTSRRTWERLSKALVHAGIAETPADDLFYPICLGFVGTEATIAFQQFCKTIDYQVTGEEVLRDYPAAREKVQKLGQEKQNVLIEKVVDYITKVTGQITDEMGPNLAALAKDLPGELRVSLWTKVMSHNGPNKTELAKSMHTWCVESVLETFGSVADASVKQAIDEKQRKAFEAIAAKKGTPAPAAPAAPAKKTKKAKLEVAMATHPDRGRLLAWCHRRGVKVVTRWHLPQGGIYDYRTKRIEVSSRLSSVNQMVIILHECGHHLIGLQTPRYSQGYPKQGDGRVERGLEYRLAVLDEEFEAWHRARQLRDRLGIRVTDAQFERVRRTRLATYVKYFAERM